VTYTDRAGTQAIETIEATKHPVIEIDGVRYEVIGYGREHNGWVGLMVRPEGHDTKGPHTEHLVPDYWWSGWRGIGIYTSGHTYRIPKDQRRTP